MKDLWMEVEMEKKEIVVIDCGFVSEQAARDRADKIFALGVGRSNLAWGPTAGRDPRIHIHIPPSKVKRVTEALPISKKKTWFGATHSYLANKLTRQVKRR